MTTINACPVLVTTRNQKPKRYPSKRRTQMPTTHPTMIESRLRRERIMVMSELIPGI